MNRGFLASDSFLLDNIEKIRHINTIIVQVCVCQYLTNIFVIIPAKVNVSRPNPVHNVALAKRDLIC